MYHFPKEYIQMEFVVACETGRMGDAQQLWSPSFDKSIINDAFQRVCYKGHLSIAQWLFEKSPELDLSSNDDDDAFKWACFNGHLSLAQWLVDKRRELNLNACAPLSGDVGSCHIALVCR